MFSVARACQALGVEPTVSSAPAEVLAADRLIVPGVGAFGKAMENLDDLGLTDALRRKVEQGTPFLGICLGMQLLFEESTEFGTPRGLGLIPGSVELLQPGSGPVPQVGWNRVEISNSNPAGNAAWEDGILKSLEPGSWVGKFKLLSNDLLLSNNLVFVL